jgi:hypothetical protein
MSLPLSGVSTNLRIPSTNLRKPSTDRRNLSQDPRKPSTDLRKRSLYLRRRSTDLRRVSTNSRKASTDRRKMSTDRPSMRRYLEPMTLPGGSKTLHRLTKRLKLEPKRHHPEMKPLSIGSQRHPARTKRHPVDKKRKSVVAVGAPSERMPHLSFMRGHLSAASPRQDATERTIALHTGGHPLFAVRPSAVTAGEER